MKFLSSSHRPFISLGSGATLLFLSGFLLYSHAVTLQQVKEVSVPLAAELPQLERTAAILKEQTELAELETASTVGSVEEKIRSYVLPTSTDFDRTVATFEILRDVLEKQGNLSRMSEITFGERSLFNQGVATQPLTVSFAVTKSGMQDVVSLLRLAGIMTVGSALTPDELSVLIEHTEQENPAGIVALEQFLSTDLLSYAQNTRVAEDRLLRSFSSTDFVQTLQHISNTSLLSGAAKVLQGEIGTSFDRAGLWPLQFMTIEKFSVAPGAAEGWYLVTVGLHLHTRESSF